jgi:hypothetical protein
MYKLSHSYSIYLNGLLLSQIGYWEVYDGSAIRELEGSLSGAINGMHISQSGQHFVTGTVPFTFVLLT